MTEESLPRRADRKERRSLHLSPRQAFISLAAVLAVLLVCGLIYLYLLLSGSSLLDLGGEPGIETPGIDPLFAIEGPGTGDHPEFDRPQGIAFGKDGRIYVSDTGNDRVCVFDKDGDFLFEFGGKGIVETAPGVKPNWEGGLFNFPLGIDVDEEGNVYVADFSNDQVQVFDPEGKFLRAFPDPKEPTGRGSSGYGGTGIAVTDVSVADGRVFATDVYQVFVFTTEGKLLAQYGKPGVEPGDLDHPNGIAAAPGGGFYVSDSNHNRVTAFDEDGEVLWNTGRILEGIDDQGERVFGLPRGLTVTKDGEILVVDSFDFTLVRLSADGAVLSRHGDRGVELGQMNFPNDVDTLGNLVLVADKENDRVQVFKLVRE